MGRDVKLVASTFEKDRVEGKFVVILLLPTEAATQPPLHIPAAVVEEFLRLDSGRISAQHSSS